MNALDLEFCVRGELMVSLRLSFICRALFWSAWMGCLRIAIFLPDEHEQPKTGKNSWR